MRKTHNQGVFDAYTAEMKRARKSGILTGLPDGYGAQLPTVPTQRKNASQFSTYIMNISKGMRGAGHA